MQISRFSFLILFILGLSISAVHAQDAIPDAPSPARLVNDFAGILSAEQTDALERKLVAFNDTTSTQITIVTIASLQGYDPSDFAQRLGEKWGVGGSKFNNGFVVLIKPKSTSEKGEAFIATGYGVESLVPDATAWDIVNNEMIPYFRQNDYYGGIDAAVETLFKFTSGEFKADKYGKSGKGQGVLVALILFILAFVFFTRGKNNRNINRRSSSTMFWPFLFGSGGGGNWGSFSGGSGGFGGGGGFGGFGGGSFGGGGAGGSW